MGHIRSIWIQLQHTSDCCYKDSRSGLITPCSGSTGCASRRQFSASLICMLIHLRKLSTLHLPKMAPPVVGKSFRCALVQLGGTDGVKADNLSRARAAIETAALGGGGAKPDLIVLPVRPRLRLTAQARAELTASWSRRSLTVRTRRRASQSTRRRSHIRRASRTTSQQASRRA